MREGSHVGSNQVTVAEKQNDNNNESGSGKRRVRMAATIIQP